MIADLIYSITLFFVAVSFNVITLNFKKHPNRAMSAGE